MVQDDPLTLWLTHDALAEALPVADRSLTRVQKGFDELESLLARPAAGKRRDFGRAIVATDLRSLVRLPDPLRARAEALYPRLLASTGAKKHAVEEALLTLIGFTAAPASVPFLRGLIDVARAGDQFQRTRRQIALAGLAYIAIRHGEEVALDALRTAATHDAADVRAEAAMVLGRMSISEGMPFAREADVEIRRMAMNDPEFAPRFLARGFLFSAGAQFAALDADRLIAIEATLGIATRTIEMRSTDTLDDLADAILQAFGWDDEHLYSFHLTGDVKDARFEVSPFSEEDETEFEAIEEWDADEDEDEEEPLEAEDAGAEGAHEHVAVVEEGAEDEDDDDALAAAAAALADGDEEDGDADDEEHGEMEPIQLGHLGMPVGHEFLFRYDFGDDHRFHLRVVDLTRRAAPGVEYPRVSERKNPAPSQYLRN